MGEGGHAISGLSVDEEADDVQETLLWTLEDRERYEDDEEQEVGL